MFFTSVILNRIWWAERLFNREDWDFLNTYIDAKTERIMIDTMNKGGACQPI